MDRRKSCAFLDILERSKKESVRDLALETTESGKQVLKRLESKNQSNDFFRFDKDLHQSCKTSELMRILAENTTLKDVWLREDYLSNIDDICAHVVLEIIGRLPKLEKLSIWFPDRLEGSAASLLCSALPWGTNLTSLRCYGLRLVDDDESEELAAGIAAATRLQSLELHDFVVYESVNTDPLFAGILPILSELNHVEIRMKFDDSQIEGMFYQPLCASASLETLILWNMKLDAVQVAHLCQSLQYTTSLKRLELWMCDLGPIFGISLGGMMENNLTLERVVICDVEFYGSGLITLFRALRINNRTLKELHLIGIGSVSEERVSKSASSMMADNLTLQSVTFKSNKLTKKECIHEDQILRRKLITENFTRVSQKNTVCTAFWKLPFFKGW